MANISRLKARDLHQARDLLRKATVSLGDRQARVASSPMDPAFELRSPLGQPVSLRLASYRPGRAGGPGVAPNTVLVLKKAPVALLERLRRQRASFVDIGRGVVRLELPWLVVDRSDLRTSLPRSGPTRRSLRSPFGDRASLVTRLLARTADREWQLRELAAAAKVSTMTASHVVRQLEGIGAVQTAESGRAKKIRIANLPRLVEHWSYHYDWTRNLRVPLLAPVGDPQRFLSRLPQLLNGHHWALTMHAGASLVAPIATWEKVHVYLRRERGQTLDDLAGTLGYEPDDDGALVLMEPWYHESLWTELQTINHLPVVSCLQLILDLWRYPVRGREQAEHLLRTVAPGGAPS